MKLIRVVCLSVVFSASALASPIKSQANATVSSSQVIQDLVSIHDRVQKEGLESVLARAQWPKLGATGSHLDFDSSMGQSENPFDDCFVNPSMPGCDSSWGGGFGDTSLSSQKYMQIKDDGVQILATEVLYQTLTFFKVKHAFGKIKLKPSSSSSGFGSSSSSALSNNYVWAFKVITPVDGVPYNDLETDSVLGAIKQFRKYVIGLLCNEPSPNRVLAMLNKYDVGNRFRWDMAWALLGNELPDAPNKYMRFGAKWRKFSLAMDGIQNTSVMRLRDPNGDYTPWDPSGAVQVGAQTSGTSRNSLGYIAREAIGVIRLAGDIVAEVLNLFCVTDLSVNQKLEGQKEQAVYKLLELKKKAYDRYGPLRPVLEEMGKKATEKSGVDTSFFP